MADPPTFCSKQGGKNIGIQQYEIYISLSGMSQAEGQGGQLSPQILVDQKVPPHYYLPPPPPPGFLDFATCLQQ